MLFRSDRRPKFHLYKPNVAIITGIEWDHINVFPTFDIYKEQFAKFIDLIEEGGTLIYCDDDKEVNDVATSNKRTDIAKLPYNVPEYKVEDGVTYLTGNDKPVALNIFGRHNLLNLTAARYACSEIGIRDEKFNEAISSFGGASKRLELVKKSENCAVYKDFAHAPSKLRATINAMREQYPDRKLVACMELHTFSSLTQEFLQQYHGTMDEADVRCVYFSQHALQLKKLPPLDPEAVREAFGGNVEVFTDSKKLVECVIALMRNSVSADAITHSHNNAINLLMMSSGNFDGIDFATLANEIITD